MKLAGMIVLVAAGLSAVPAWAVEEGGEAAVAAPQKRCLTLSRIKYTRVLDDQTILFQMRGDPDYKNILPHRCPGLGFYKSFGYRTGINAVCDLDIITVLESGRRGASCGLGTFVEYHPEQEESEDATDTEQGKDR